MRQVIRLVRYVLPFLLQLLPGIFLLAAVGFLEAFRLVLLKPVLDRTFTLADAAAAHRRLEASAQFGKIVLDVP